MSDAGAQGASPAASAADDPPVVEERRLQLARLRDLALVPAIIVIAIVGYIVNPVFISWNNANIILQAMSGIAVMVLAETLILLMGRIDLSLESTFGLAPGVAAWLTVAPGINHGLGWVNGAWAVPICLLVGALVGALNGLLIIRFQLSGFIVTLGMLITLRGLLEGISKGQTFFALPASMKWIGQTFWWKFPVSVWLTLALFAAGIFVLGYTRRGRALYAIGGNAAAAKAAGIRTDRVVWGTLIVGGTLAALGGLMFAGQYDSVAASQGNGYIFTVFAAAVIGGVSLNGGKGTVFGAFSGVLLLFMIRSVLTFGGVPAEWLDFLNGVVILATLIISRLTTGQGQD